MKNNFFKICLIFFYILIINSHSLAYEQFNFDVTEVEIKEEGNLFIGKKRGIASTPEGLLIEADEFKYNKLLNILNASGNIKFNDTKKKYSNICR